MHQFFRGVAHPKARPPRSWRQEDAAVGSYPPRAPSPRAPSPRAAAGDGGCGVALPMAATLQDDRRGEAVTPPPQLDSSFPRRWSLSCSSPPGKASYSRTSMTGTDSIAGQSYQLSRRPGYINSRSKYDILHRTVCRDPSLQRFRAMRVLHWTSLECSHMLLSNAAIAAIRVMILSSY